MSRVGRSESFGDFVGHENSRASVVLLARAFGEANPDGVDTTASDVSDAIMNVLRTSTLSDEEQITLRDLLAIEMSPFLKDRDDRADISMLDVITLGTVTDEQVCDYLRRSFSLDLNDKDDLKYVCDVFKEAIEYFDEKFARNSKETVNPELRNVRTAEDVCKIFKTASGVDRRTSIPAACGVLRIAAVINYANRDPRLTLLPRAVESLTRIRDQFFPQFRITSGQSIRTFRTGRPEDADIPVIDADIRTKERKRIIAKLLHKPTNSSDEILDHVGMRVITTNPQDTLRIIHAMLFNPSTAVLPGVTTVVRDSKNRLINRDTMCEALKSSEKAHQLVSAMSQDMLPDYELSSVDAFDNPHSLPGYKAINIVLKLPITLDTDSRREFPIELQFMDLHSMKKIEESAPHGDYVRRQMLTVRERVLGANLDAAFRGRTVKER